MPQTGYNSAPVTAAVVWVYMIAMVAVGFYLRERIVSATDFLVAGRKLGLALTTATMAAVQIGAGVILGGAELGAQSGAWPGMWYGLGCAGGLFLAGLFVAPRLRGQNAYVPLDYFGKRYGESRDHGSHERLLRREEERGAPHERARPAEGDPGRSGDATFGP
jgi:SSS family solute:Na+ symporter